MIEKSLNILRVQIEYSFKKLFTIFKRELSIMFNTIIRILERVVAISTEFRFNSNPAHIDDVIKDYFQVN